MTRKASAPATRPRRNDTILQARQQDSYKLPRKLPDPTCCPECGAVFTSGRWQWLPKPVGAHAHSCPACQRVADGYPAGYVTLEGEFAREHRKDVLALARSVEKKEKAAHPLQRIMAVEERADQVLLTTTDAHLARDIGEALRHAYHGALDLSYAAAENMVRVHWHR